MSKPTASEACEVSHREVGMLILLMVVTLGFYSLYLLYQWAKEINGLEGYVKHQPWLVLLLSIISCGIAAIIYECLFAVDLAKATAERGIATRRENIVTLVIVLNSVAFATSLIPLVGIIFGAALGTAATAYLQVEMNKLAAHFEAAPVVR
jgi:hypothetical protein